MTTDRSRPSSSDQLDWRQGWSWQRLLEILSKNTWAEARRSIARELLGLQVSCFERLFDGLDDPTIPDLSWNRPVLRLLMEFPFEWDTEVPLDQVDPNTPGRDLFMTLLVLSEGVAIPPGEQRRMLLPKHISRYLTRVISPAEAKQLFAKWTYDWKDLIHYGDAPDDPDDCTIRGHGRGGLDFRASLRFAVSPRVIDHQAKKSAFFIVVDLHWHGSDSLPPPNLWRPNERQALRSTVRRFFEMLRENIDRPNEAPREISTSLPQDATLQRIWASTRTKARAHYLSKASVKPLAKTIWSRFPKYLLGYEPPILPISDGQGAFRADADLVVMSMMLYPDDNPQREAFVAKQQAHRLHQIKLDMEADEDDIESSWPDVLSQLSAEHGFLSPRIIESLATVTSGDKVPRGDQDALRRGLMVGEVLLTMITCAVHHPEHVSIQKAGHLIRCGIAKSKIDPAMIPGQSPRFIKGEWKRFRPVAHLWAAARRATEEPDFIDEPQLAVSPELLAVAEELRRLGEECFGRGQKAKGGPVLDPSLTWRTPRDLELPRVKFNIPPLPAWSLARLAEYRA